MTMLQRQWSQSTVIEYFFPAYLHLELVWMNFSLRFLRPIGCVSYVLAFLFSFCLLSPERPGAAGGTASFNWIRDMVIAGKRDDHAASRKDFATQGHLTNSNEFSYAPGSFRCSSCAVKNSKRPRRGLISIRIGCG